MTFTKLIGPLCFLTFAVTCRAEGLNLGGAFETIRKFSTWEISQNPQQSIDAIDQGALVTFQGVPLAVALQIPYPTTQYGFPNDYYLSVEFGKGRRTAFGWVEVDRWLKDKRAYVVIKRNNKAIGDDGVGLLVLGSEKSQYQYFPEVDWLRVEPFRGTLGWEVARDRWVELIFRENEFSRRVGGTRKELENGFVEERPWLTGATRTYFSRKNTWVKVDVEFLEGRITKISKLYLERPYCGPACADTASHQSSPPPLEVEQFRPNH
jgi:hypothetical protein